MKKQIVYEQPLNKHIKYLLRLEYLFAGIMYRLKSPAEWDSRAVVSDLIDILELIVRVNLSTELCNDLQLHRQTLQHWCHAPDADEKYLAELIQQTQVLADSLAASSETMGTSFAQHHLVHLIRQRRNIVGGTGRSDLPGFYYWLHQNPKQRQAELMEWLAPLEPLRDANDLNLYLIRNNNAQISTQVAEAGLFKTTLASDISYQLVQVVLPLEQLGYPDIRAGYRNLTIKFMQTVEARQAPKLLEQDINFELRCCVI